MKKFFSLMLCVMLALTALAACSNSNTPSTTTTDTPTTADTPATTDTDTPAAADTPVVDNSVPAVPITVHFLGCNVTEDADVIAAANARMQELGLNITIRPIWGDWSAGDLIQNILDTGDTSVDVVFTCSWAANYVRNAKKGVFVRLDDPSNNLLEQYGQGMRAAVPEFLWDGFTVETDNGVGIYAVPGYKDYAQLSTFDVNNTRLNELGFDVSDFNWDGDVIFDPKFEEVLAASKEKYGDSFYPLMPEPDNFVRAVTYSDADITDLGAFYFGFDPTNPALPNNPTVGLCIDEERYIRVLEKLNEFYNKGYIDPRCAITDESRTTITGAQETGNYLVCQRTYAYGFDAVASKERGIDAKFMPISKAIVSTIPVQGSGFAISAYSKNKAEAMQFLNAWYTDKELATILCYGVEGTHYTTNNDNTITLDNDKRASFGPWRNGMGNIFILPPQDVEGPNYYNEFKEYNNAGVGTAFLGFTFDPTPVENEIAALLNVKIEYSASLTTGAADPSVKVAEYRDKLYANGIQKVMDELNAQLQAFYATK